MALKDLVNEPVSIWFERQREIAKEHPRLVDILNEQQRTWGKPIHPAENETAIVTLTAQKSAALCFDRVWGFADEVPDEVRFGMISPFEFVVWNNLMLSVQIATACRKKLNAGEDISELVKALRATDSNLMKTLYDEGDEIPGTSLQHTAGTLVRRLSEVFRDHYSCHAVPMYDSTPSYNADFVKGDYSVVVATLCDLDIVDESHLSWDQVLEFRKDSEASRKLRRMTSWLDSEMAGKSQSAIVDRVGEKLSNYQWAIKKHGISTVVGTFSSVLDPKVIATAAGTSVALFSVQQELLGILAGVGIVAGKTAIKVTEATLNLIDARRPGPEVAFVQYVKDQIA